MINKKVLNMLKNVSTATLTSELLKLGFSNTFMHGVKPIQGNTQIVGEAFTLRYIPSREDFDYKIEYDNKTNKQRIAIEAIAPGEVLVIDARGETNAGTLGDILSTRLQYKGVSGLVTDGALRDTPSIKKINFPAYAKAAHASVSSVVHHPAEFQVPIGCGGVMVRPKDIIFGDEEGIVVIPRHLLKEVAQKSCEREYLENWIQSKISKGANINNVYPPNEETLQEFEEWKNS